MQPQETQTSPLLAGFSFRKVGPYLLFALLGVAMLFGQRALLTVTEAVHGVSGPVVATANMTGAEVAADAQASGWVQAGAVTSKLITAGGAFLFFIILQWVAQQLTHPGPTSWAKKRYTAAFDALDDVEKFRAYGRIRLYSTLLAVGALIFAAVVQ